MRSNSTSPEKIKEYENILEKISSHIDNTRKQIIETY
jgi:hypothetical protein